jgi:hypothetical protein
MRNAVFGILLLAACGSRTGVLDSTGDPGSTNGRDEGEPSGPRSVGPAPLTNDAFCAQLQAHEASCAEELDQPCEQLAACYASNARPEVLDALQQCYLTAKCDSLDAYFCGRNIGESHATTPAYAAYDKACRAAFGPITEDGTDPRCDVELGYNPGWCEETYAVFSDDLLAAMTPCFAQPNCVTANNCASDVLARVGCFP